MKVSRYICSVLFFLLPLSASAQADSLAHSIGVNIRPAYVIPTHGFYKGYNINNCPLKTAVSAHFNYTFSFLPETRQGQMYPGAYQGAGVAVQTFYSHKTIGTPLYIYLFQGSPIIKLSDRITLDYEWNLGLSGGWKPIDDLLMGSSFNIYINVGLFLRWRLNDKWDIQAGPEYTHFSNGDTAFPNSGANTVNFRLGIQRYFNHTTRALEKPEIFEFKTLKTPIAERLTYDLTIYGAWRADRMTLGGKLYIIDKAFPLGGIQFNPLYHFNHSLSIGPALDIIYDSSANLIASVDTRDKLTYSYPSFLRQTAAGISVRGEVTMPIFAVNIGLGYNLTGSDSDLRGLYGIFALKAFLTDSLFLNVGYRLGTVLYAHNLMFGIGWRFYKNKAVTN